jgi:hypothetical protein
MNESLDYTLDATLIHEISSDSDGYDDFDTRKIVLHLTGEDKDCNTVVDKKVEFNIDFRLLDENGTHQDKEADLLKLLNIIDTITPNLEINASIETKEYVYWERIRGAFDIEETSTFTTEPSTKNQTGELEEDVPQISIFRN